MDPILLYTQSVMHVMRNVHKGLHSKECANGSLDQLTMQQFQTVLFVQTHKQVAMSEIAHEMQITPATATSLVDKLVKKQLLQRIVLPENRRNVYVVLSPHAEIHFQNMIEKKLQTLSQVFAQMKEQDRHDLLRVLTHLNEIVDTYSTQHKNNSISL